MAVTRSPHKTKTELLALVRTLHPAITFTSGDAFMWSAHDSAVTYPAGATNAVSFAYSLLHEIGHGLLGHDAFANDLELTMLERDAWDKAVEISAQIDIVIPDDHIEACMDTYRDWLYTRSLCPHCHQCGIQMARTEYSCAFCRHSWTVSASRLCRVTRRAIKKSPSGVL